MSEFQGNPVPEETIELRDFIQVCIRRRWVIITFVVVTVLLTLVWTLLATKIYRSETEIWVKQPSSYVISTDVLHGLDAKTTQEGQIELMKSNPYQQLTFALTDLITYCNQHASDGAPKIDLANAQDTDEAIEQIDLILNSPQIQALGIHVPKGASPSFRARALLLAVGRVRDKMHLNTDIQKSEIMDAEAIRNTDMVTISYTSPDRERARILANAITLVYLWKNQTDKKVDASKTVAFIEQQLDGHDKEPGITYQLQKSESDLCRFKQIHKIVDLDSETKSKVDQLAKIEDDRMTTEADNKNLGGQLDGIKAQLRIQGNVVDLPVIEANPMIQMIQGQIVSAQTDLMALQTQYGDRHPKVIAAKSKLQGLESALKKQAVSIQRRTALPNPTYEELAKNNALVTAQILGNKSKLIAIRKAQQQLTPNFRSLPVTQMQLARLMRRQQELEKAYLFLEDQLRDARMTEQKNTGDASLVQMASKPAKKVRPRVTLSLALSLMMGLILGAMIATILEHLDNTMKNPEDVAKILGIPVLGLIPQMDETSSQLIMQYDGRSPVSEAYRTLRSNIKFTSLDRPIRTLLVTSPTAGEGKSTTISNIAISMAMNGMRVILMDTDLRRPTVHRVFGASNEKGLTNILVDEMSADQVIQNTEVQNLQIITSGPIPPNPAEILESTRMQQLITSLRDRCDILLLDSPPVVVVTDAAVLGSTLDGVVLVVESGKVPRQVAKRALELLQNGKSKVLGVVVNKVNVEHEGGYYYYYTRYYGDGHSKQHRRHRTGSRK